MPLYQYYFSANPGDPSPPSDGLLSIEAANRASALEILRKDGRLPDGWRALWIHFLVWVDQEGQQRGFESIELSQYAVTQTPETKMPE